MSVPPSTPAEDRTTAATPSTAPPATAQPTAAPPTTGAAATAQPTSTTAPSTQLDSVEQHLARILDDIAPLTTVDVRLEDAHGFVLAATVASRLSIPVFDNSAMDGYAVRHADVAAATIERPVRLEVLGDVPAGSADDPRIGHGQCVRIMTGAPMPADADAVVQLEHTDEGTEHVDIRQAPAPGMHIRRAGSDVVPGENVLSSGVRLTGTHIAAAAAAGHSRLTVRRSPRVAIVSTGSELRPPGATLARGQIPESNSLLLAGLVAEAGATLAHRGTVPDEPAELAAELERVEAASVDLVILSGGVSVGAYDVVKATLAPIGTVGFHRVAMQPGKPQAFGRLAGGTPVFGLPGNPVSVAVSFEAFVRPALLRMQGARGIARERIDAVVARAWRTPPGRRQFMPITVDTTSHADAETGQAGVEHDERTEADGSRHPLDSRPRVRPATSGGSGSHLAGGLAAAAGYAIVPEHVDEVRAGETVAVMLTS